MRSVLAFVSQLPALNDTITSAVQRHLAANVEAPPVWLACARVVEAYEGPFEELVSWEMAGVFQGLLDLYLKDRRGKKTEEVITELTTLAASSYRILERWAYRGLPTEIEKVAQATLNGRVALAWRRFALILAVNDTWEETNLLHQARLALYEWAAKEHVPPYALSDEEFLIPLIYDLANVEKPTEVVPLIKRSLRAYYGPLMRLVQA